MEKIYSLEEHPAYLGQAADFFHGFWGIPREAYAESMAQCVKKEGPVPQWYFVLDKGETIGGLGVIENDFHDRKELSPNVCAVGVKKEYRCRGIAGALLKNVCRDMKEKGISRLYLLTDHDSFYERYGWRYFCPALGDGEETPSRLYVHDEA